MDRPIKPSTVDVWMSNVVAQSLRIEDLRRYFPIVAVDTEFPGFLRNTPRRASEEVRYADVKHNVDGTDIIQFGLALFDADGNQPWPGCCWQFNFTDFDPDVCASSPDSIRLLQESGHDLHKNRRDGVSSARCYSLLRFKLFGGRNAKYITFHGLYDVAYLMKVLTAGRPLPDTLPEFLSAAANLFGELYDLKHVAKSCPGLLGGELGLMKLAKLLSVNAEGVSHQAGFDSMVIGLAFGEMNRRWKIEKQQFVMVLYGAEEACADFKNKASIDRARRGNSLPPRPQLPPPAHGAVNHYRPPNNATAAVGQMPPALQPFVVNYGNIHQWWSPVMLPATGAPFNPVQPALYYNSWPYPMQPTHRYR